MDLVVRPLCEADAPALNAAVRDSVEHLRPWMPWAADEPHDDAWRAAWIREQAAGPDRVFGYWVGDDAVGIGGLHRRIAPTGLEIGYWVRARWTRRGIATEGARQLCALAFATAGIDHVEIRHDRANVASGRVAQALGFTLVCEHARERSAPADEGVRCVWRLRFSACRSRL